MTFQQIYQKIQNMVHDDSADVLVIIKDAINEVYQEICNMDDWHWLVRLHKFYTKASDEAGTVAVENASKNIVGSETEFDSDMIGMNFIFPDFPEVYVIASVPADDSIMLEEEYQGWDDTGSFLIFENEISLPAYFRRPFTVKLNGRALNQMDMRNYRKIQLPFSSSEPSDYIVSLSTLILYPIPDEIYFGELYFYADPAELSADGDTPLLPPKFHQLLVYGGYIRANSKLEDIEYNPQYEKLYNDILQNLYVNNEIDSDAEDQLEIE